jgi:hypothetical protein
MLNHVIEMVPACKRLHGAGQKWLERDDYLSGKNFGAFAGEKETTIITE